MKFINFILSIYLVVISCLPCADMEVYSSAHASLEISSNHDDHSHDKENDLCSPFCICNCCGAQVLSYSPEIVFDFPLALAVIETKEPFFKSVFTSNFYGSIWQPPQIA
jgi:hypothetical protein